MAYPSLNNPAPKTFRSQPRSQVLSPTCRRVGERTWERGCFGQLAELQ